MSQHKHILSFGLYERRQDTDSSQLLDRLAGFAAELAEGFDADVCDAEDSPCVDTVQLYKPVTAAPVSPFEQTKAVYLSLHTWGDCQDALHGVLSAMCDAGYVDESHALERALKATGDFE